MLEHTLDNVAEKYSKWFLKMFVFLWDLDPTRSASRAIASPTRSHHPLVVTKHCIFISLFGSDRIIFPLSPRGFGVGPLFRGTLDVALLVDFEDKFKFKFN